MLGLALEVLPPINCSVVLPLAMSDYTSGIYNGFIKRDSAQLCISYKVHVSIVGQCARAFLAHFHAQSDGLLQTLVLKLEERS
jgi:hypothetical protein